MVKGLKSFTEQLGIAAGLVAIHPQWLFIADSMQFFLRAAYIERHKKFKITPLLLSSTNFLCINLTDHVWMEARLEHCTLWLEEAWF